MKLNYKTLIVGMLLFAGTLFAGAPAAFSQVSIGIQIGAPPPPRVFVRPPCPDPRDPEYVWVEGYWYPVEGRYYWHQGYWTLPPYEGAVWVVPHYERGRYYGGYWNGRRGHFEHDHHWDDDHDRDHGRWHEDHGKHKGWDKKHHHDDDDRD